MSVAENKRTVKRLMHQVMNKKHLSVVEDVVAEDYVRHDSLRIDPVEGRDGFKDTIRLFHQGFPELEATVHKIIGEEDMVAYYTTFQGVHEGPFLGIQATNQEVEFAGMDMHRFERGKIAETWAQFDIYRILRQLEAPV